MAFQCLLLDMTQTNLEKFGQIKLYLQITNLPVGIHGDFVMFRGEWNINRLWFVQSTEEHTS